MAGVIEALKLPSPLEVKRAVMAAPVEQRRQADTAGFTLNTSLTHQMLQVKAQGLLATRLCTMEITVWLTGNSLPHLSPVKLFILLGSLPHYQLKRISVISDKRLGKQYSIAVFAECTYLSTIV